MFCIHYLFLSFSELNLSVAYHILDREIDNLFLSYSELNLSVAYHISDRVIAAVIDNLSSSLKTLVR